MCRSLVLLTRAPAQAVQAIECWDKNLVSHDERTVTIAMTMAMAMKKSGRVGVRDGQAKRATTTTHIDLFDL